MCLLDRVVYCPKGFDDVHGAVPSSGNRRLGQAAGSIRTRTEREIDDANDYRIMWKVRQTE